MENPRSTSPRSIMPPYPHLLTRRIGYDDLPSRVGALRTVGVPYSDAEVDNAVALAQEQAAEIAAEIEAQGGPAALEDREITALVAYLQRLGTFLNTSSLPGPAESDLEPHEQEETIETMQGEQPGDLPGTDLEVEDLPPGTDADDVDLDRSDEGTVVDNDDLDRSPDLP